MNHRDDFAVGGGNIVGLEILDVVGADHEHDDLGGHLVEFALFDAPNNMLRLIAADAEVGWLVGAPGFFPDLRLPGPASRDGVTEE